jgi:hypothetical protein
MYESQLGALFPIYGFKKKNKPPTSIDILQAKKNALAGDNSYSFKNQSDHPSILECSSIFLRQFNNI